MIDRQKKICKDYVMSISTLLTCSENLHILYIEITFGIFISNYVTIIINLSIHLSIYLCIYLCIQLFFPSIYLFIYVSINLYLPESVFVLLDPGVDGVDEGWVEAGRLQELAEPQDCLLQQTNHIIMFLDAEHFYKRPRPSLRPYIGLQITFVQIDGWMDGQNSIQIDRQIDRQVEREREYE